MNDIKRINIHIVCGQRATFPQLVLLYTLNEESIIPRFSEGQTTILTEGMEKGDHGPILEKYPYFLYFYYLHFQRSGAHDAFNFGYECLPKTNGRWWPRGHPTTYRVTGIATTVGGECRGSVTRTKELPLVPSRPPLDGCSTIFVPVCAERLRE